MNLRTNLPDFSHKDALLIDRGSTDSQRRQKLPDINLPGVRLQDYTRLGEERRELPLQ